MTDAPQAAAPESARTRRSRLLLAGFLSFAGVSHFLNPDFFEPLVPEWMPGTPRFWNLSSGAAEVLVGALLVDRRTSRVGAWAALALFIAVYPANIQDAIDHPPRDARGIGSLVRLPLQFLLFAWAWRHTRKG